MPTNHELLNPIFSSLGISEELAVELVPVVDIPEETFSQVQPTLSTMTSIEAAKTNKELIEYFSNRTLKEAEGSFFGTVSNAIPGYTPPDVKEVPGLTGKMVAILKHTLEAANQEKEALKGQLSSSADDRYNSLNAQMQEFQQSLQQANQEKEAAVSSLNTYKEDSKIISLLSGKSWAYDEPEYNQFRQAKILADVRKLADLREENGSLVPYTKGTDLPFYGQDKSKPATLSDLVSSISFKYEAKNRAGTTPPTVTTAAGAGGTDKYAAWVNEKVIAANSDNLKL